MEKPGWVRGLVGSSFVAAFFVLLHLTDDLAQGEFGAFNGVVATSTVFLLVVWFGGIALSARQNPGGYVILLALGIFGAAIAFIHTTGAGASIAAIAQASGAFFAWVVLVAGIASILSILLSAVALIRRGEPGEGN